MTAPTYATGGSAPAPPGSDTVSHGRYRIGELVGVGGFGQVHRAVDTLTGDIVAVKFVRALSPTDLERARRELAALRWLRVPGVVRLRDDGLDGASWFMVLDFVEGQRFGAVPGWRACERPVLDLLEILARVHLAGVLHLDLKPSNLVIDRTGQVVVLDFGIARGRAVPEVAAGAEGTPRYMAPEQCRGLKCDARTDLYAVGTMVAELCPDLPPHVQPVIDAMCAADPAARPASALDAYRALSGRSPFPPALARTEPWTPAALRALFEGPDRFTHLASDAADLLWARTSGEPDAVRQAIEEWILAGRLSWSERGLVADRIGPEPLGEGGLDLLDGDLRDLTTRAQDAARTLRTQGRSPPALALLDSVLSLEPDDPGLLVERVLVALSFESAAEANLALHALDRARPTPLVQRLSALTRMARAVLRGERGPARDAEAQLARLSGPIDDPELDVRAQAFRLPLAALDGIEHERAGLVALEDWAGADPHRRGLVDGWWGQHWYRCGRYEEAARSQERAAAVKTGALARLCSTICAADAWLEVPDLPRAAELAAQGVEQAYALRHPRFEAHATWMVRAAAYRLGRALPVSAEMLDAVAELGPGLDVPFSATEAAAAWRLGDLPSAITLAHRSARRSVEIGSPVGVLMTAFAGFLEHAGGVGSLSLADAVAAAHGCPVPDFELQVLAFARWSTADPPADWLARANELARLRPEATWSVRLDVLSVAEALAADPPLPSADEIAGAHDRGAASSAHG